jgi:uncharacterized protein involved in outer membrane biogenesis
VKKVILYGLAGLLVLLIAAILIGPSLIDWNAHKGRILAAIEEQTGRKAAIDGDIDLTVFPSPALRVGGVRIANFTGAKTADMLRLKELRLRVAIGALLEGRVVVEQLDLIEPVVALEVAADGTASWDISPPAGATAAAGQSSDAAAGGDSPVNISLASVTVQNGSVLYRDVKSGTSTAVDAVNMSVSAPSLTGPFRVSADARYSGIPVTLDVKTGALTKDQPVTVSLNAALPETGASVKWNGSIVNPGPDARLSGDIVVTADNAERVATLVSPAGGGPLLSQPLSVEGKLEASRKAVALNDTRLRFGETVGTGAVNVSLGDVVGADVAISINRIDLDKVLSDLSAGSGMAASAPSAAGAPPGDGKPAASGSAAKGFSLPTGVNATLDLNVEAIQYRGEVIRQAGIRGALANGAVTLDRASALLPGGSDLSLVGFLHAPGGVPKFEGDVAVASDNLRSMLKWLGADTSALPADRLRGFSYSGKVAAGPDSVTIPDFNLRLDATTVRGALAMALRERIGFGLRLDIDQLNLDAYLPGADAKASTPDAKPASAAPSSTAKSSAQPDKGALAFLNTFDANVDTRIERLTFRKSVAQKVAFDGQLAGGSLTIRKFGVAEVAGTRVNASGNVQHLAGTPQFAVGFDVAVVQPDVLFRVLDFASPVPIAKLEKVAAKGQIEGNQSAVTVNTDITAAGAALHLQGPVGLADPENPSFDLQVALTHPEMREFVRLGMPDFNPASASLGPVRAGFKVKGTPKSVAISALDMAAGPVAAKGAVSAHLDGPKPVIDADIATSEVLLDLFRPVQQADGSATARGRQRAVVMSGSSNGGAAAQERWSREPIDMTGLQAIDATVKVAMAGLITGNLQFEKPALDMELKDGLLNLRSFSAGLFGGRVSGQGKVDSGGGNPNVAMSVAAEGIDMARAATSFGDEPRVAGPLSLKANLGTAGSSEAALVSSLSGQGAIAGKARVIATQREQQAIDAVGIAGALFGKKVKELQQIGGLTNVLVEAFGNTPADLSGTFAIQRGVLQTQDTVLKGSGASATTVATVDLPRWIMESTTSVLRSGDTAGSPYVTVNLSGSIDSPNVRAGGNFLSRRDASSGSPLDKVLPGILGGGDSQKNETVKPKDVLPGLLKGLLK